MLFKDFQFVVFQPGDDWLAVLVIVAVAFLDWVGFSTSPGCICPLISPSGWPCVWTLTYVSPLFIALIRSPNVLPCIGPVSDESVILPLIAIPSFVGFSFIPVRRSTITSPFAPAFPKWI